MGKMIDSEILHILRNPYGHKESKIREASLAAANRLEEWERDYVALLNWARDQGLDVTARC